MSSGSCDYVVGGPAGATPRRTQTKTPGARGNKEIRKVNEKKEHTLSGPWSLGTKKRGMDGVRRTPVSPVLQEFFLLALSPLLWSVRGPRRKRPPPQRRGRLRGGEGPTGPSLGPRGSLAPASAPRRFLDSAPSRSPPPWLVPGRGVLRGAAAGVPPRAPSDLAWSPRAR